MGSVSGRVMRAGGCGFHVLCEANDKSGGGVHVGVLGSMCGPGSGAAGMEGSRVTTRGKRVRRQGRTERLGPPRNGVFLSEAYAHDVAPVPGPATRAPPIS